MILGFYEAKFVSVFEQIDDFVDVANITG